MNRANLLVSFKVDENQKEIIADSLQDYCEISFLTEIENREKAIEKAEILFVWNPNIEFKNEEYSLMKNVKFLQLFSAGGDHLSNELFKQKFDIAGNVGAFAIPMAEHIVAMALALAKDLKSAHLKLKEGNFDQFKINKSVRGSVCAIIGFGGIGKATANLMRPLGCKIFAINSSGKTDENVDFIGTTKDLEYVLKNGDFIVITIALNNSTRNLIGSRELNWMKKDAILVNVARGEIIDEAQFYQFLKTHPDFKAGIDAWWVEPFRHGKFQLDHPFLELPNVIGTPHSSAMVPEVIRDATVNGVKNIKAYLTGKNVKGVFKKSDYI